MIFVNFDLKLTLKAPKTPILIQQSEQVETGVIMKIIEFLFQQLFMGQNQS